MIENIENQNSSKQTMRCNWLNLDNLIRALKINNINKVELPTVMKKIVSIAI